MIKFKEIVAPVGKFPRCKKYLKKRINTYGFLYIVYDCNNCHAVFEEVKERRKSDF